MREYYECHITIESQDWFGTALRVHAHEGWKFSKIDGDPNLGPGVKCYATRHMSGTLPIDQVRYQLEVMAKEFKRLGENVVREKVELVVYDSLSEMV